MTTTFINRVDAAYKFELIYIKGKFKGLQINFPKVDNQKLQTLISKIDVNDINITKENLKLYWIEVENTKPKKFNACAVWANLYFDKYKISYKINEKQAGMLNNLGDIEEEFESLVKFFFTLTEWWSGKKDISTFTTNINEIRRLLAESKTEAANPKPKPKFPEEYSKAFESTLNGAELSEYWAYLRSIGWKKGERGWYKEVQTQGEMLANNLAQQFKTNK